MSDFGVPPDNGCASFIHQEIPRVCLFSQRGFSHQLSRCCAYEFEDVIASVDSVELLAPAHTRTSPLRLKVRNRLSFWTPAFQRVSPGPRIGLERKHFDVFLFVVQFARDLLTLDAIRGWRAASGMAICYLEEIWAADIPRFGRQLDLLKQFDLIFCNCAGSVNKLQERLDRPVEYVPPGVDMLRFCPDPDNDARCIDVMAIGRKSDVTHRALMAESSRSQFYYQFDSLAGPYRAKVPHEHRVLLANQIKHSRFFVANTAKFNQNHETASQEEVGFRFFEGLAGGAVLLGTPPDTPVFFKVIDWEDAVIPTPIDCPDIIEIIHDLNRQPDRLQAIRRRNVANSLRKHDWLYRWALMLHRAGLPATPAMQQRHVRLETLARRFDGNSYASRSVTAVTGD